MHHLVFSYQFSAENNRISDDYNGQDKLWHIIQSLEEESPMCITSSVVYNHHSAFLKDVFRFQRHMTIIQLDCSAM